MQTTRSFLPSALVQPGVRVRTLVVLRWIAIVGQLVTLGVVGFYLHYPLPWASTLAAVGASVLLNLGLSILYPRTARLEGGEALLHLAFDLVQLGVLLYLTGGLTNPFAVLLLVPVTISATLLSARATLLLLAVALLMLVVLWAWALPLPWANEPMLLPDTYRFGVFVAVALGMIFLATYVWQVSAEGRRRSQALVATQAALEREVRMSALGSLAAAAAHELGGPLGTIMLVARSLEEALSNDPEFGADVRLLNQEAKRSREILVGIARRAEAEDPFPALSLPALLHEVAQPFETERVSVQVEIGEGLVRRPVTLQRSPELLHGLSNLVANAARHARSRVTVDADAAGEMVTVTVSDDGEGFDPDLLPHLGEPFLGPSHSGSGGTGLGIFIATTLLERTGATIRFANNPEGGARVEIRWHRSSIVVPPKREA